MSSADTTTPQSLNPEPMSGTRHRLTVRRIKCNCPTCKSVNEYLIDPVQSTVKIIIPRDKHWHVQHSARESSCDVKMNEFKDEAIRRYGLAFTKTTDSFQSRRNQFNEDLKILGQIKPIIET